MFTFLFPLLAVAASAPSAAKASPWSYQCKVEAKLECQGARCELEDFHSLEFSLSARRSEVGLYSVSFAGKPLIQRDAKNLRFAIEGRGKGSSRKNGLVGEIELETGKFQAISHGNLFRGQCQSKR